LLLVPRSAQKLFGWFGGYGIEGTGLILASIGFEPGALFAVLVGVAEFFGGLMLAAPRLCGGR
jgi:putative oxidoreductase|tara:strand:+ start:373 stop:561 length:189 start_codon:yes stop_codon:yes gene_type:complete